MNDKKIQLATAQQAKRQQSLNTNAPILNQQTNNGANGMLGNGVVGLNINSGNISASNNRSNMRNSGIDVRKGFC